MTAGVAAARRKPKGGWTRYGPPSYWSKLGRTSGTRNTRDYVARQVAEENGVSMSTARREIMPHLAVMTHHCKNRELTVAMAARYDLEEKHVSFITGSGEDTNKVQSIVEDAQELREDLAVEHGGGAFEGGSAGGDTDAEGEAPGGDDEVAEDGEGDAGGESAAQASLDGSASGSETDEDEEADKGSDQSDDEAAEDDQQSGLSDFM
jgi:replication factor C large subunit